MFVNARLAVSPDFKFTTQPRRLNKIDYVMKLGGGVKSKFAQNSNCSVVTHGSQGQQCVCVCTKLARQVARKRNWNMLRLTLFILCESNLLGDVCWYRTEKGRLGNYPRKLTLSLGDDRPFWKLIKKCFHMSVEWLSAPAAWRRCEDYDAFACARVLSFRDKEEIPLRREER